MTAHHIDTDGDPLGGTRPAWRLLKWLVISTFVALLAYFAFRGYVSPDLLFHFSILYCLSKMALRAVIVFATAIVIGPTPPGTGVIAAAFSRTRS